MTSYEPSFKYGRLLVALHWLMFLLLIVVYAAMEFRVLYDKGMPEREFMKSLHFMFGLCVFLQAERSFTQAAKMDSSECGA